MLSEFVIDIEDNEKSIYWLNIINFIVIINRLNKSSNRRDLRFYKIQNEILNICR